MRRIFIVLMFLTSFLERHYAQEGQVFPFQITGMEEFFTKSEDGWLTLNAPDVEDPAILYFHHKDVPYVSEWQFAFKIGVNPSSSNMIRYYIMCDSTLSNGINIAIGDTDDNIALCQKKNGSNYKLITSPTKQLDTSSSEANVMVRCSFVSSDSVQFELFTDISAQMTSVGKCTLHSAVIEKYTCMALSVSYTKTRKDGIFHVGHFVIGDKLTIPETNPDIIPDIDPTPNPEPEPVPEPTPDPEPMPEVTDTLFYRGCVVINEIMPKPVSDVDLPNVEYVELYNASDYDIDLSDWTISTKSTKGVLPSYVLRSGNYITLCIKTKVDLFDGICEVISPSSWPALTNSECLLVLKNNNGLVSDYVDYNIDVFDDTFKANGGWSVERVNSKDISGKEDSWAVSVDPRGGTPGEANSVKSNMSDKTEIQIRKILLDTSGTQISLKFDQALDTVAFPSYVNISGIKTPIEISWVDSTTLRDIVLSIDEPLEANKLYKLSIPYCVGLSSEVNDKAEEFKMGIVSSDVRGKVVINEIMSSSTKNADYIEIYNTSAEILDLSKICFCHIVDGVIKAIYPFATESTPFFAGEHLVLAKSIKTIFEIYDEVEYQSVCQHVSFPNLSQEGEVAISTISGEILDRVEYSDKMHSMLIIDTHDVALERIFYDKSSAEMTNWTSAASFNGFATPTRRNSQCREGNGMQISDDILLVSKVISPDGDGIDDRLIVKCNLGEGLWNATMIIYDVSGSQIAVPYNNIPMPVTSELYWDGVANDGSRLSPGTYIIYIKAWQTEGETKTFKKTCIVAYPHK